MKKEFSRLKALLNCKFIIYVLLFLVLYISIGQLCHYIKVEYTHEWIIQVRRIADALLFAFPILFLRKKKFVYPYLILINLYFLSIVWYFRTYGTIMPLSSYLMVNNLDGLLPSILHSIHIKDILIIFPTICFFILYNIIYCRIEIGVKRKNWESLGIVLLIFSIVISSYWPSKRWLYDNPLYLFGIQQVKTFKEFGIINFWIYQVYFHQGVSGEEKRYAENFMKNLSDNLYIHKCDSLQGNKNLVLVLVESLQSWPIGLAVNNVEITPNLNRLLERKNAVSFLKEVPQTKDGRSSDAQLLLNTGLLPLLTGATSGICTHNTFPSLADALREKGYTTASFICDGKDYWNQEVMTNAYKFEYLFDRLQGESGREKADENLFKSAIPIMKKLEKPFYAQLVTLSTHSPYLKPLIASPLETVEFQNEEVKYYLIAIQYVDYCIGEFIKALETEGLYNKSIVVITGDHEQMTFNQYENRVELKAEDCFVPFIVLNSPLISKHTEKVIGQMDIYPSLLNLMGCCDYYFTGIGESVFNEKISDYAMFRPDIVAEGDSVSESTKKYRQECWRISDILLRTDSFGDSK